ncbi:hypothetical protein EOD41_09740 [Mucilaginibacter limnophilus]|uniref:Lipocalin-like domain-containing protein n=1 Tax=Mucilaginibacter limnophilus TaxID=1932778 RepID=A0A437MTB4_9SPHI|nr:hypothetical protein [Mucilaginibacter limnophilus]RVU00907.1 hypothetical protein EOD41_09740 [Mucilaginibacter limnophilus]
MRKLSVYSLQLTVIAVVIAFCSFKNDTLKGVWQYCGGIYNGKKAEASTTYTLQRKYKKDSYEAFMLEPDEKPFKYEAGNYRLSADTCFETQTFSAQGSKTKDITIAYTYSIVNDTLTFSGVLPNGTTVQEYWKKVN